MIISKDKKLKSKTGTFPQSILVTSSMNGKGIIILLHPWFSVNKKKKKQYDNKGKKCFRYQSIIFSFRYVWYMQKNLSSLPFISNSDHLLTNVSKVRPNKSVQPKTSLLINPNTLKNWDISKPIKPVQNQ